jgi:inhibitor of cysteine peptidase
LIPAAALVVVVIVAAIAASRWMGSDGGSSTHTLDAGSNGGAIVVHDDDEIVVTLPSNPTTGYAWEVANLDASKLSFIGQEYHPSTGATNVVGQGGTQTLRFKVLPSTGNTMLALKYWRAFEGDSSIVDRFAVSVTYAK